jgi:hypothetical protein
MLIYRRIEGSIFMFEVGVVFSLLRKSNIGDYPHLNDANFYMFPYFFLWCFG